MNFYTQVSWLNLLIVDSQVVKQLQLRLVCQHCRVVAMAAEADELISYGERELLSPRWDD